jgi:D-alanyl-D-alanine carboxypeptidase (penicillin-binding protein 5/6)
MALRTTPLRRPRTVIITGAFGISLSVAACGVPHATAHPLAGAQAADTAAPLSTTTSRPISPSASAKDKAASVSTSTSTSTGTSTTTSHVPAILEPASPRSVPSFAAPAGTLSLTLDPHQTIPGSLTLAWPSQGQAQIDIDGDTLGSYGPVQTAQPIASVTKTMTAYLILRDHPLSPGQQGPNITITAADVSDYQYDLSQNMSVVPVQAGEQLTENQALQALMLASADNIADVLAHWDTGTTSDTAFVTTMNAEAANHGMTHTAYADASGYDPNSISTAPDQITLAQDAMTNPYFADLVDQSSAVIPVAGTIANYNSLLGTDGIDGIKTGSTGQAGGCLLFNANITVNGRPLTITGTVLGQDASTGQELGVGLAAAKALVGSTESKITTHTLISANTPVATITLYVGGTLTLHTTQNLTVTGWPGEPVTLSLSKTQSTPTLQATSPNGELLGSVSLD